MKFSLRFLGSLAAIPLLIAIFAVLFKLAYGPYWLGINSDPSYMYFFNFLYLIDKLPLPFTDHPGTTLDLLGALIVKLTTPFHNYAEFFFTAVENAERTLTTMNTVIVSTYVLTLGLLGWYAYQKSRDIVFVLLIQSSAFLALANPDYPVICSINSETMILVASNLLMIGLTKIYFNQGRSLENRWGIYLGFACAFGLATKLTFAPLFLLTLFLVKGFKPRAIFSVAFLLSGLILLFPIYTSFPKFIAWIIKLVTKTGVHGSGGGGCIDVKTYVGGFLYLIKQNPFTTAFVVLGLLTAFRKTGPAKTQQRAFLIALCCIYVVHLLMVSKQPIQHYMVPMICLSGLTLAVLYHQTSEPFKNSGFTKLFVLILLACEIFGLIGYYRHIAQKHEKLYQSYNTVRTQYGDGIICPYYRSSSPLFALACWNNNLDSSYSRMLSKAYPDFYYYDYLAHDFKDFTNASVPLWQLQKYRKDIYIYGTHFEKEVFAPYTQVEKVQVTEGGEAIYKVLEHRSPQAEKYFRFSQIYANEGNYQDALKFGLYAKALDPSLDIDAYLRYLADKSNARFDK